MKIGTKIRNAREDLDMSQSEVASLIPMNQSNYSKIERDLQEPNLDQMRRICQILKIDPNYLLSLDKEDLEAPSNPDASTSKDRKLLADIKALIEKYR